MYKPTKKEMEEMGFKVWENPIIDEDIIFAIHSEAPIFIGIYSDGNMYCCIDEEGIIPIEVRPESREDFENLIRLLTPLL